MRQRNAVFGWVSEQLAVGRAPLSDAEVELVVAAGFTHAVDCRSEVGDDRLADVLEVLHVPAVDDGEPQPVEWFEEICSFVEKAQADDSARVLIFCAAGRNRAPSATYAALRAAGCTPAVAQQRVRFARPGAYLWYIPDAEHWIAGHGDTAECELCTADELTERHFEAPRYWIADCKVCKVPMVVWREHGTDPSDRELCDMLLALDGVAAKVFPDARGILDAKRRSIPGHWHAHARPVAATDDWRGTRAALRTLTLEGPRADHDHGWRTWKLDDDGVLISAERNARWPARTEEAKCTATRPCSTPPNDECWCGICFFATLGDALASLGDSDATGRIWACITTEGVNRRDVPLLGATWRCARATIETLIVGPDLADRAEALSARYGTPVVVAEGSTLVGIGLAAVDRELPAIDRDRPRWVDLRTSIDVDALSVEQAAGGAYRRRRIGPRWMSAVADDGRPIDARYTWFAPGVDELALTAEECDAILAAISGYTVGAYGTHVGRIEPPYLEAIRYRLALPLLAAGRSWWDIPFDEIADISTHTYGAGDELAWHTDRTPQTPAMRLSLVAWLNDPDEYEGGTLEFRHDSENTSLPNQARGTIAVYPSTLLHRVTPVTSGRRTVVVAFAEIDELRQHTAV